MPEDLKNAIQHDSKNIPKVWLSCIGDNPADVENIGPLVYYPQRGYPANFFPFTNQDGYLEPLVAVHFERPHRKLSLIFCLKLPHYFLHLVGIAIVVECTLWAENLQDALKFELLVD